MSLLSISKSPSGSKFKPATINYQSLAHSRLTAFDSTLQHNAPVHLWLPVVEKWLDCQMALGSMHQLPVRGVAKVDFVRKLPRLVGLPVNRPKPSADSAIRAVIGPSKESRKSAARELDKPFLVKNCWARSPVTTRASTKPTVWGRCVCVPWATNQITDVSLERSCGTRSSIAHGNWHT